jgi:hypothetical protein
LIGQLSGPVDGHWFQSALDSVLMLMAAFRITAAFSAMA